jgi:hypothetical protein
MKEKKNDFLSLDLQPDRGVFLGAFVLEHQGHRYNLCCGSHLPVSDPDADCGSVWSRYLFLQESVFKITSIIRRMGEEALELSAKDLELAREKVKAVIEHHLDEREYIDIGLDAWDIIRNL